MQLEPDAIQRYSAQQHFDDAKRAAFFEDLTNLLTGRERYPLSYEALRRGLPNYSEIQRGLQTIPVDKIVGSVGRYRDFTRSFMPRRRDLAERWKRLDAALSQLDAWPPIDVYQVGDRYFVQDGNHRVSVARANGVPEIEAMVTEVQTTVPLDLDRPVIPQLLTYERERFQRETNFGALCPGVEIHFTELGGYTTLLEHIQVHRWYMGEAQGQAVTFEEAVENWCHTIYRPLVRLISRMALLDDFPTRTPGDLYIWLTRHMHELRQVYGDDLPAEVAAADFQEKYSEVPLRKFVRDLTRSARTLLSEATAVVAPEGDEGE